MSSRKIIKSFLVFSLLIMLLCGCETISPVTGDKTATPSIPTTTPSVVITDITTAPNTAQDTEPAVTEEEPSVTPTPTPTPTPIPTSTPIPTQVPGCKHIFEEKNVKPATCTENGERTSVCIFCGYTYIEALVSGGHSFGDWQTITEAGCLTDGMRSRVCASCSETENEVLTAKGHSFGAWQTFVEAGCLTDGERSRACSKCSKSENQTIDAKGHSYGSYKVTVQATCTTDGEKEAVCSRCGDKKIKITEAYGHSYTIEEIASEATCEENGRKISICERCYDRVSVIIYAKGHNYDDGTVIKEPSSCKDSGIRRYVCSQCEEYFDKELNGNHVFGEPYMEYANLFRKCEYCDFKYMEFYLQHEPAYSDCDPNSALFTDVIKLEFTEYQGPLATWPERWFEFTHYVRAGIRFGRHEVPVIMDNYVNIGENESMTDVYEDFLAFREAFEEVYGWKPIKPVLYDADTEYASIDYESQDQYESFRSQARKLSDQRKEEIVKDLVAYHVLSSGVWDGMQAYNAMAALHDRLVYQVVSYDDFHRLRTPYEGLAGGSSVCSGIAQIYELMLKFCGIECDTVIGTMVGEGHEWNIITFSDGTVRYADPTNFMYRDLLLVPDYVLKYNGDYRW